MFNFKGFFAVLLFSLLLVSKPTLADHSYEMEVEKRSNKSLTGYATKVNSTHFITDPLLLENAKNVFIIDRSVTPAAKVVADIIFIDEKNRVAILQASNISGKAIIFAKQEQSIAGKVLLQTKKSKVASLVQRFEAKEGLSTGPIYVHNALYKKGDWAAPLFNNCEELLGISVFESSFLGNFELPESEAYALSSTLVKSLLNSQKVAFTESNKICLSDQAIAQQKAIKALEDKIASEKMAADEKAKLEALLKKQKEAFDKKQQESRLQKEKSDKAIKEANEAKAKSDAALKKSKQEKELLAKQKADAEIKAQQQLKQNQVEAEQEKYYLLASAIILLLIMLLIFLKLSAKRKKAVKNQASELQRKSQEVSGLASSNQKLNKDIADMQRTFHDVLLDGITHDGNKIRIKINGKALASAGEQTLGRESSMVDYVLAPTEISRKHLKLFLKDEKLFVEDLDSNNGSWVNNSQILPGQATILNNGAILKLSSIEFKVIYL